MNIAMIGTGYVGLVSGACFSEFGVNVICVDKDKNRIDKLNKGIISIYEPGLEELIKKNVKKGRLLFITETAPAVEQADIVFIAVGTLTRRGDGYADPRGLDEAKKNLVNIEYFDNPYSAVQGADAVVIMTEWNEYRALSLKQLRERMKGNAFIDLKDIYIPEELEKHGFRYTGVGIK